MNDGAAGGLSDRDRVVCGTGVNQDDLVEFDGLLFKPLEQSADMLAFVQSTDDHRHPARRIVVTHR